VFGILIVEDLVAILILVMLSSLRYQAEMDSLAVLKSAMQLMLVVGTWFLFGMFIVPHLLRIVSKYESEELSLIISVALCLGMVVLASKFEYSVALGAFMMGSILAETRDVKHIEHLIAPLKDIFGAVFFVSVGMMIDPKSILSEWPFILAISALVIFGKLCSVFVGAILSGQKLSDAVRVAMSMAQIGEFSFIIATLGLTLGLVEPRVYPIIVCTSMVTSFVTPYLIRSADAASKALTENTPRSALHLLDRYRGWLEIQMSRPDAHVDLYMDLGRWTACAVITTSIFGLCSRFLAAWFFELGIVYSDALAWIIAFVASTPFIWAMIVAPKSLARGNVLSGRRLSVFGAFLAVVLLGVLSREFMFLSVLQASVFTVLGVGLLLFVLRRQVEARYRWFERQFLAGFSQADIVSDHRRAASLSKALAPWNAALQEVEVPVGAPLSGQTLQELKLREAYNLNIVCIERGVKMIVTPLPDERLLPADRLLVFGDDPDVERFRRELIDTVPMTLLPERDLLEQYRTGVFILDQNHGLVGRSIRQSRLREDHACLVVGIERGGERLKNPSSDFMLNIGDVLWIVGPSAKLDALYSWKNTPALDVPSFRT